eukprot:scaffold20904_cov37-Tisochrysis_lutea.AAC.2
MPLTPMSALALFPLPELHDEDPPLSRGDRHHRVWFVGEEDERITPAKGVLALRSVCVCCHECTAIKLGWVREQDVDRKHRAGIVVALKREATAGAHPVILHAPRRHGHRRAAQDPPVPLISISGGLDQLRTHLR